MNGSHGTLSFSFCCVMPLCGYNVVGFLGVGGGRGVQTIGFACSLELTSVSKKEAKFFRADFRVQEESELPADSPTTTNAIATTITAQGLPSLLGGANRWRNISFVVVTTISWKQLNTAPYRERMER